MGAPLSFVGVGFTMLGLILMFMNSSDGEGLEIGRTDIIPRLSYPAGALLSGISLAFGLCSLCAGGWMLATNRRTARSEVTEFNDFDE